MKSVYVIKNIELTTNKVSVIRDNMVVDFYIMEDYANRRLPIIKLGLMLDIETINSIVNYKEKPTIKLEVYENILSSDDETLLDSRIYIKDTFSVIPKNEKTDFRILEDMNGLPRTEKLDPYTLFPVYLIKMGDVSYFSKEHSFVFSNCSKADVLKAIFKMKDIPLGLVIATPPDTNKVDQIIIPHGDLITNIQYLNNRYGLYESVPVIYQDLFNIYCLCSYNPNIVMAEGEDEYNINFIVPDDRSNDITKSGYVINKDRKIYEVHSNVPPVIKDFAQTSGDIKFGTVMSVDKNGNIEKITVDDSTSKLKFVYNDNPLTKTQIINRDYSSMKQVEISVTDISLRYIKPYKICNIQYSSALNNAYDVANKRFMITGISSTLVRNGDIFNITSSMILNEIK